MIIVDGGQDADRGPGEHIGGVEAAAKTHFHQGKIGVRLGEGVESQGRGDLEKADRLAGVGGLDLVDASVQLSIADQGSGNADALGEPHQVGRSQHMNLQAGGFGDGAHDGRGRPLAIGARHMDHHAQTILRPAQGGEQPLDPAGGEVDQRGMQGAQPRDRAVGGANGVVLGGGRRAQAAEARARPIVRVRRIEPSTTGMSLRVTTRSTMPRSTWNSAV